MQENKTQDKFVFTVNVELYLIFGLIFAYLHICVFIFERFNVFRQNCFLYNCLYISMQRILYQIQVYIGRLVYY